MINRTGWMFMLMFVSQFTVAQMADYDYKMPLSEVSDSWHYVDLPHDLYSDLQSGLNDVRVFGVGTNGDTTEVPYLWDYSFNKQKNEVDFELINSSFTDEGYYYTFAMDGARSLSEVNVRFNNENFDWRIRLEGSNDQNKWFTVLDDYRILSLKNGNDQVSYTKLHFPIVKFSYLRLLVMSDVKPDIEKVFIENHDRIEIAPRNYTTQVTQPEENQKKKNTTHIVRLAHRVPINQLELNVSNRIDYHRTIRIDYLLDSVKTKSAWHYNYRTLVDGVMGSDRDNTYYFNRVITDHLRVRIFNEDNIELNIGSATVKGDSYRLIARFPEARSYFLCYGAKRVNQPRYDLTKFIDKIPSNLATVTLEEPIYQRNDTTISDINREWSKLWLWGIMLIIISILGWFTYRMWAGMEVKS